MADGPPGKGLFGWLGRQVGHVARAVRHDPAVVARRQRVEERDHPDHPGVTFRRTTVDEVRRRPPGPAASERGRLS